MRVADGGDWVVSEGREGQVSGQEGVGDADDLAGLGDVDT